MVSKKKGQSSFILPSSPTVTAWASVAGKKEKEGPLGGQFDIESADTYFGEASWEMGERKMQQLALNTIAKKVGDDFKPEVVLSGDLLNQCIGSAFTMRNTGIPHIGLYGACSTMAESLMLASMLVDGGYVSNAVAMTSSHFATSERQYRFPLGYGGQRTPTAQWTTTGCGAVLVANSGKGPKIHSCTIGAVTDLGVKDAANMGAAMAPAAFETIRCHFEDLQADPEEYDLVVTGDLGHIGLELLTELLHLHGISLGNRLTDCGVLLFDRQTQDVHAGGSGCGCSAITLCASLLNQLHRGELKKILFCGTGALLSPTSTQQNLPIPGVCHGVCITGGN